MKAEQAQGARVYAELRGAARAADMQALARGIGAEAVIADLSLEFVFGKVWGKRHLLCTFYVVAAAGRLGAWSVY